MAEPVLVEVGSEADALDLSRALAVRGLAARPVVSGRRRGVELDHRCEDTDRLIGDLFPALEAWRADRGHGPLRVTVGKETHLLD